MDINAQNVLKYAEAIQMYCGKKQKNGCKGCPFRISYSHTGCWLNGDYEMFPSEWNIDELRKEKEREEYESI